MHLALLVGVSLDRVTLSTSMTLGLSGGKEKRWRAEDVLLKELGYIFSVHEIFWPF